MYDRGVTPKKLARVFQQYAELLKGYRAGRLPDRAFDTNAGYSRHQPKLQHIAWMCQQGLEFVQSAELGKAQRWLGFIQGVLWMANQRTLNQLKDDNRET